jgi:glycosyltransferase involved in cell wall biosynthesis
MGRGVPVITNQIGVEQELPAGSVVALSAYADASELADAILRVCCEPAEWHRLSAAGWAYSAAMTEDVVAAALVAAIADLVGFTA